MLATVGALILAVTPALLGHAIATPQITVLAVLSDAGRVLGAGGWLGSLFVLLAVGLPALHRLDPAVRGAAITTVVKRFSDTALICAALMFVTGTASAWIHLGRFAALWETGYGRILLVKLSVFALVVAVGLYNWLVVRPVLDRTDTSGHDGISPITGATRLSRSASLELLFGAIVIVITAILVAMPTPTA